jgi:hypothetical protein
MAARFGNFAEMAAEARRRGRALTRARESRMEGPEVRLVPLRDDPLWNQEPVPEELIINTRSNMRLDDQRIPREISRTLHRFYICKICNKETDSFYTTWRHITGAHITPGLPRPGMDNILEVFICGAEGCLYDRRRRDGPALVAHTHYDHHHGWALLQEVKPFLNHYRQYGLEKWLKEKHPCSLPPYPDPRLQEPRLGEPDPDNPRDPRHHTHIPPLYSPPPGYDGTLAGPQYGTGEAEQI